MLHPETPAAPAGTGPLSGTVVLELTTQVPGPTRGKLLIGDRYPAPAGSR